MQVFLTGSEYKLTSPGTIPSKMKLFLKRHNAKKNLHPVIRASFAHLEFIQIHPFEDGNGRVARLILNLVLMQENFIPIAIPPIWRQRYIQTLETGWEDPLPFTEFIAEVVQSNLTDYINLLSKK